MSVERRSQDSHRHVHLNLEERLRVRRCLQRQSGDNSFQVADLFALGERTISDGTIGSKGLDSPQIRDFFLSGQVDRVIIVSPGQPPIILTLEEFLYGNP
jgi:hypothetical protein